MEGSQSSVGLSTETLDRGMAILQGIADHGVVKQELPEDEREILCQIEAPPVVTHQAYIRAYCTSEPLNTPNESPLHRDTLQMKHKKADKLYVVI